MTTEGVPTTGALSVDQAVAQLNGLPKKEETTTTTTTKTAPDDGSGGGEQHSSTASTVEDTSGAETQTDGQTTDDQTASAEDDQQSSEQAALEPPKFWSAEEKEHFGGLPRDVQEIILKKEDERNSATARALQDTAEKRKAAEAQTSKLTAIAGRLEQLVPQAEKTFADRWQGVDWDKVVDQYGADQALKLRNQMETEKAQVQQLKDAKNQVEQEQFQTFVRTQESALPTVCPDLCDPKLGTERRQNVGKFLVGLGVSPNQLRNITAVETAIAYDAMRWRNGEAKAKELAAQPRQAAPAKKTPAKPGGQQQRTPANARLDQLSKKPNLTIDEAVELQNLRGRNSS